MHELFHNLQEIETGGQLTDIANGQPGKSSVELEAIVAQNIYEMEVGMGSISWIPYERTDDYFKYCCFLEEIMKDGVPSNFKSIMDSFIPNIRNHSDAYDKEPDYSYNYNLLREILENCFGKKS